MRIKKNQRPDGNPGGTTRSHGGSGWARAGGRVGGKGVGAVFLFLLGFAVVFANGCGRDSGGGSPSVLVVTIDTLRADRLSCLGGPPGLTPVMDRIAATGVLFENAISQSCFTAPAMATLATGVYPLEHGVMNWGHTGEGFRGPAIAERFAAKGYRTVFLSGHGGLGGIELLRRGYEVFSDRPRDAAELNEHAFEILGETGDEELAKPLFLWVHYFDPHGPYTPPEARGRRVLTPLEEESLGRVPYEMWTRKVLAEFPLEAQIDFFTRMYDAEIAEVDSAIGLLVEAFQRSSSSTPWLMAVSADHGENLGDHLPYFDHRDGLFDSLVRVPLILAGTTVGLARFQDVSEGIRLGSVVEARGLAGFLAGECGLEFEGPSLPLVPTARGEAFSDSGWQSDPHKSLRTDDYKLTLRLEDRSYSLYDLSEDPSEQENVGRSRPDHLAKTSRRLAEWARSLSDGVSESTVLTPEVRERLRNLGYQLPGPKDSKSDSESKGNFPAGASESGRP